MVLAMDDTSPVFEAPGGKRTRKTDERVLGKGHHAEVTLKLAVCHIHRKLVNGELLITGPLRQSQLNATVRRTESASHTARTMV